MYNQSEGITRGNKSVSCHNKEMFEKAASESFYETWLSVCNKESF